jgi:phage-related protein
MKARFDIHFLDEAWDFILSLDEKVKAKVIYNIQRSRLINDPVLFKKLNKEVWEFRTQYEKKQIRLFAFWNPGEAALVVCTHGIFKKSQKTPVKEILKAQHIRLIYLKKYRDERK